jgi:Tfp pilus assembly protein PilF
MLKWLAGSRVRARQSPPDALFAEGVAQLEAGAVTEALPLLERACEAAPDNARWHGRLGTAYHAAGNPTAASASYRRALALDPGYAEMRYCLAIVAAEAGDPAAAEQEYRAALALKPSLAEARFNLAVLLHEQDRLEEAVAAYREVLAGQPEHRDALLGLGLALRELRDPAAADGAYAALLAAHPDDAEALFQQALARLAQGRWQEGWGRYEHRWRTPAFAAFRRDYGAAEWTGESLQGRSILVYAEQGLGDTLQFVRYLPALVARAGQVVLACQPPLVRLLRCLPDVTVVSNAGPVPGTDYQVPLLSLPHRAGHDSAPLEIGPYLRADPAETAAWRARLADDPRPAVGLVWSCDPHLAAAARARSHKSIPLPALEVLAGVGGVRWVSLQLGAPADRAFEAGGPLPLLDARPYVRDFADTAAALAALDLVITVDTSVVHAAGALGRPAWVLLPAQHCWRWEAPGETSVWYPTVRMFRQDTRGDWQTVLARVARALAVWSAGARTACADPLTPDVTLRTTESHGSTA